jgi:hypothetical protein
MASMRFPRFPDEQMPTRTTPRVSLGGYFTIPRTGPSYGQDTWHGRGEPHRCSEKREISATLVAMVAMVAGTCCRHRPDRSGTRWWRKAKSDRATVHVPGKTDDAISMQA